MPINRLKFLLPLLLILLFTPKAFAVPNGSGNDVFTGNVGIGTIAPAQALDVKGTVSANYFIGNGAGITNIPTTQWTTINTNDVYLTSNGNVGVGTTITGGAALSIMNGNVGIGTWVPTGALQVATGQILAPSGTAAAPGYSFGGSINTGIQQGFGGTGRLLFVQTGSETVYIDNANKYLTLPSDMSFGFWNANSSSTTYAGGSPDANISRLSSGVIGIGSGATGTFNGTLVATNIGIGTLTPRAQLDVAGTANLQAPFIVTSAGNVGIGTWVPGALLSVGNNNALTVSNTGNLVTSGTMTSAAFYAQGETHLYEGNYFDAAGGTLAAVKMSQQAGLGYPMAPFVAGINGVADINYSTYGGIFSNLSTVSGTGVNYGIYVSGANNYFQGNVGIGTWIPAYNLDLVNGTARQRIIRRVNTITSSATPAINTDTTDLFTITALATNITSMTTNLTGTPNNGDLLEIRILDNGSAQTITWGSSFASTTTILPGTTVVSTTLRVLLEWNSASSKWECIGVT